MKQYREIPISQLALQLAGRHDVDSAHILRQVEGWQRLRTKVPSWAAIDDLLYPPRLALEQCSGEAAARYKAKVVAALLKQAEIREGKGSMADLTGGLGVDFSFIAPLFGEATYVERQEELCRCARHNFPLLGLEKTRILNGDGIDHLKEMQPVDLLFLDPARRDGVGRKTVLIEDCEPDVMALRDLLLEKARFVVLKLSTMLDIAGAVSSLGSVDEIHVVSVGGECKDLLLVLTREAAKATASNVGFSPIVTAHEGDRSFRFTPREEAMASPTLTTTPGRYLYEPGPALMKAGAFKVVATRFGLQKLHPSSHLYTSSELLAGFPGRTFEVIDSYGFSKADLKRLKATVPQANLTVRNFPSSVDALRKKLKLREGGSDFLFATTLADATHVLIHCRKAAIIPPAE